MITFRVQETKDYEWEIIEWNEETAESKSCGKYLTEDEAREWMQELYYFEENGHWTWDVRRDGSVLV